MFPRIRALFRNLFDRRSVDAQLQEEIEACVDILAADRVGQGMDPAVARREARLELGGIEQVKEGVRDATWGTFLHAIWQDLRYATRRLRVSRGFSVTAVLTLGVAIGGATAIYSFIDQVLFRPPAGVDAPEEVVSVYLRDRAKPDSYRILPFTQFNDLRDTQTVLEELMGYARSDVIVSSDSATSQVSAEVVTGNFFTGLRLPLLLGRGILPRDDVAGAEPVMVLSEQVWQRQFGGSPAVIGQTASLNGNPIVVIGVAKGDYEGLQYGFTGRPGIWIPVHADRAISDRVRSGVIALNGVGRLKAGVTPRAAEAGLSVAAALFPPTLLGRFNIATVVPIRQARVFLDKREELTRYLGLLLGVSLLILVAACLNVANFLMSHGIRRRAEMAVRLALGASRRRLLQQLLTESLLLGIVSGAVGILLAVLFARVLEQYPPLFSAGRALTVPVTIDMRVLLFAAAVTLMATTAFGVFPAALASRSRPMAAIKGADAIRWSSGRRFSLRHTLLGLQVAMAMVLVVVAVLYARSLARINGEQYTFVPDNVLLARVTPQALPAAERRRFYTELLAELNAHPDVVSVSLASNPPLSIGGAILRASQAVAPQRADYIMADGGYFETLRMPVTAGRVFRPSEDSDSLIVINEPLAEEFWPGEDPLGKALWLGDTPWTVIGTVDQPRCQDMLDGPRPCVYVPFRYDWPWATLHVRTRGNPLEFSPVLRRMVAEANRAVALDGMTTANAHLTTMRAGPRVAAFATIALALLACALVVMGCAALVSALVSESQREIGIRIALGSTKGELVQHMIRRAMTPYTAGIALGVVAAWYVATLVSGQLYDTDTREPAMYLTSAILLFATGICASYWPAYTAARTDPARTLLGE